MRFHNNMSLVKLVFGECLMKASSQVSMVFTRDGVEEHEVFKVGDLSSLPTLGHARCLVQLFRAGQRNPSAEENKHCLENPMK